MIRRTVREWERIRYGDDEQSIPSWAADRIASVAARSPVSAGAGSFVVAHGRNDLRAGQIVGVVSAEGCSLEILPKIDGLGEGDVRRRLVHMLSVALDIDVAAGALTDLGWQGNNLLEILIRLFAEKLAEEVRRGLPRSYVPEEGDLPILRGRIDIKRQFTALASSPQRIACRYDSLSADIALNRAMKTAVARLRLIARSSRTQRLLTELAFAFADISDLPAASIGWSDITIDRTNARWRDLLILAKLLLRDRYQTTSLGAGSGFSLLFPMNTLFEEYVAKTLVRTLRPYGLAATPQGGRLHCLEDIETGTRRFQTRPDIIIRDGGKAIAIVDTKWKRIGNKEDDPKEGISQADIYQMMAYGRVYNCNRLLLLYPHHAGLIGGEGIRRRFRVASTDDQLSIATVDLSQPNSIGQRLSGFTLALLDSADYGAFQASRNQRPLIVQ